VDRGSVIKVVGRETNNGRKATNNGKAAYYLLICGFKKIPFKLIPLLEIHYFIGIVAVYYNRLKYGVIILEISNISHF
jgi:hypothetical protein